MTAGSLRAQPLGDLAVIIAFGSERSAELLERIHRAAEHLRAQNLPYVEDVVPAYLAIAVYYDALHVSYGDMAARLITSCEAYGADDTTRVPPRQRTIPVVYDGVDLDTVAERTRLSPAEVIARHTARTYTVDLLGFVPGFGYLSELDPSLHLPRRDQPRPRVAAGSVAIAGSQTGVYPLDTPGGWHIIGRTEVKMFDPSSEQPTLLRAGDLVRFVLS